MTNHYDRSQSGEDRDYGYRRQAGSETRRGDYGHYGEREHSRSASPSRIGYGQGDYDYYSREHGNGYSQGRRDDHRYGHPGGGDERHERMSGRDYGRRGRDDDYGAVSGSYGQSSGYGRSGNSNEADYDYGGNRRLGYAGDREGRESYGAGRYGHTSRDTSNYDYDSNYGRYERDRDLVGGRGDYGQRSRGGYDNDYDPSQGLRGAGYVQSRGDDDHRSRGRSMAANGEDEGPEFGSYQGRSGELRQR